MDAVYLHHDPSTRVYTALRADTGEVVPVARVSLGGFEGQPDSYVYDGDGTQWRVVPWDGRAATLLRASNHNRQAHHQEDNSAASGQLFL